MQASQATLKQVFNIASNLDVIVDQVQVDGVVRDEGVLASVEAFHQLLSTWSGVPNDSEIAIEADMGKFWADVKTVGNNIRKFISTMLSKMINFLANMGIIFNDTLNTIKGFVRHEYPYTDKLYPEHIGNTCVVAFDKLVNEDADLALKIADNVFSPPFSGDKPLTCISEASARLVNAVTLLTKHKAFTQLLAELPVTFDHVESDEELDKYLDSRDAFVKDLLNEFKKIIADHDNDLNIVIGRTNITMAVNREEINAVRTSQTNGVNVDNLHLITKDDLKILKTDIIRSPVQLREILKIKDRLTKDLTKLKREIDKITIVNLDVGKTLIYPVLNLLTQILKYINYTMTSIEASSKYAIRFLEEIEATAKRVLDSNT